MNRLKFIFKIQGLKGLRWPVGSLDMKNLESISHLNRSSVRHTNTIGKQNRSFKLLKLV